ncbi:MULTISPECIES: hypothetical protein [Klebsiella]|jgi:hypothetical protein|uniref:hypothetical protein n=1 Tax=Klebsiella TaxID=570 RepID=UPI000BADD934|nr:MULTISPECIES: hypothetical protein [Klebsiella]DAL48264.1 MAG TPA_asm: hypothetical protein [Caudoviricetes sp.]HCI6031492.1 hypothetical protein [Klebsiella quasipneumoniae subsp. quasipneumoniae]HDU3818639.1 hypothetical protein [Klebsiella pneumoniae subsp. pneumoniae]EIW8528441.1 hypothetical protein [Klebsiella pneumoniae]MBQ5023990.1 hypothetical protein [Klebsiella pneumoniae]
MSLTRNDMVYDLYYASNTDPMTADRTATLTIQLRDEAGATKLTTQLSRTIVRATKAKVYAVGQQMIVAGDDALLVATEAYLRKDTASLTEDLISKVMDFIEGNMGAGSTWMGVYGMKIFSGEQLSALLPASVLDTDGTATKATA